MASAAVVGNPFRVLRRALERTARDQLDVRRAMAKTVKDLIKGQFAAGVDPSGRAQPARVDGEAALVSRKLPGAIKVQPTAAGVEGTGELKDARRQWLEAHQKGHEFPARTSTGNRIAFNAAGKRVSIAKLKRGTESIARKTSGRLWWKKTTVERRQNSKRVTVGQRETFWRESKNRARLLGRITNARAHTVGARKLIARLIYPEGQLGPRWSGWLRVAINGALRRQLERDVKNG